MRIYISKCHKDEDWWKKPPFNREYGVAGDLDVVARNIINELYRRNVSANVKPPWWLYKERHLIE